MPPKAAPWVPTRSDDVGERRIDVVGALAFYVVELPDDRARTGVDRQHEVTCVNRRVVVGRCLRHHARAGAGFGDHTVETIVCVLCEHLKSTIPFYLVKNITQYNIVIKPINIAIKRNTAPLTKGRLTLSCLSIREKKF